MAAQQEARAELERCAEGVKAEIWRVNKVVWQAFCAALIPVSLRKLPQVLARFLAHLRRSNDNKNRPRQIEAFLRGLAYG